MTKPAKPTQKAESKPDINPGQQTLEKQQRQRDEEAQRFADRSKEINDGDAFIGESMDAKRRLQEREMKNEGKDVPLRNIVADPTGEAQVPKDDKVHKNLPNRFDPSADNYKPD